MTFYSCWFELPFKKNWYHVFNIKSQPFLLMVIISSIVVLHSPHFYGLSLESICNGWGVKYLPCWKIWSKHFSLFIESLNMFLLIRLIWLSQTIYIFFSHLAVLVYILLSGIVLTFWEQTQFSVISVLGLLLFLSCSVLLFISLSRVLSINLLFFVDKISNWFFRVAVSLFNKSTFV